MSKKDNTQKMNGASLGEISTIRDILMGQHINDFEARLDSLQQQLEKVEAKLADKMKELSVMVKTQNKEIDKEIDTRFTSLQNETEGRIAQAERSLQDGLANLQQVMEDARMNDKERIGRLLTEAGNALLKS